MAKFYLIKDLFIAILISNLTDYIYKNYNQVNKLKNLHIIIRNNTSSEMIKIHCPNCGEPLDKIEHFCPYCRYKFDDRMKMGNKNLVIRSLQNNVESLENQVYKPEDVQIEDLRREVRLLKQEILNGQKSLKKKEGEFWYFGCVLFVVILFINYLIAFFSRV